MKSMRLRRSESFSHKSAAPFEEAALRLSKNPGELERAAALSNFQSSPAACTVGSGLFYRREIPFPGEKIASLQVLRPEPEGFKQNLRGGGSGGGACSPVHQLVKKDFFDKLFPPPEKAAG